jgi:hypothetical protein
MLIRHAPSGKHILIWILVLLLLAVALLLGAFALRGLVRHPALGSTATLQKRADASWRLARDAILHSAAEG